MACSSCGKPRTQANTRINRNTGVAPSSARVVDSQSITTNAARPNSAVASNPNAASKRTKI